MRRDELAHILRAASRIVGEHDMVVIGSQSIRRRRHSSLGQISPVVFEMQHCTQTAADQIAA